MGNRNLCSLPVSFIISLFCICVNVKGLDNGLVLTPPMGWMPFERYRCMTDCVRFPRDCISERLFRRTADLLVSEGYAKVGYKYLIIDDCWMERQRDTTTDELLPNENRFPSGMNDLSNYIHNRGLKFGLYHDVGYKTCMYQGPGAIDHFELDAKTFASWGVDYIKMDGCYASERDLDKGYPAFGQALNNTKRPMVYSCSWPFYKSKPNYQLIKKHCNLWRFAEDINDSYESIANIMQIYHKQQHLLANHSGPGHWNDPDMLVLGNYFLSYDQSRLQFAIWAVIAAPLIMTNDLETVRPEIKALLQNRDIIAINQDRLGNPGKCILTKHNFQIWARPVEPINDMGIESFAIAFVNHGEFPQCPLCPQTYNVFLNEMNLVNPMGYTVVDLFNVSNDLGLYKPRDTFSTRINPKGVNFYKFTVVNIY
ncbi:alpha-N-acetylgalactosaminidase isoform X1 [Drosophila willistoni]|uniref:alpha-N-acetylgalactosaminidase isoform X1 n=2 Tax=Drosophila willistoni TaxID=7260 RepID=UPI00017D9476|nr:alpha-N-acetylgalactosaminidase isoform X1 [Drosophila willistoni]